MNKKACAEAMKRVMASKEFWPRENLDKPIHLSKLKPKEKDLMDGFLNAGLTITEIHQHKLARFTEAGTGCVIIPQTIQEAINAPEQEPPSLRGRGGR